MKKTYYDKSRKPSIIGPLEEESITKKIWEKIKERIHWWTRPKTFKARWL